MDCKKLKTGSLVAAIAIGVLCAPVSALAQHCATFDTEAPGARSNPWAVAAGTGFPAAQLQFTATGTSSAALEIWAPWGPFSTRSLRVWGFPSDVKIEGLVPSGFAYTYPSKFSLNVADYHGNATVAAYSPSGAFLASQVAPRNTLTSVSFSGLGPIGYVYIFGNQNEMWVDDVCIQ